MKLSRTQKIFAGVACLALYSIPLATINGAFDIFMKTEGAGSFPPGESTGGSAGTYKGWIEIDSFGIGGNVQVTTSGGKTVVEAPNLSAMSVNMAVEQTSPAFFQAMTEATLIPELKLWLRNPTQDTELMRIYLKNAYVESVNWAGSSSGDFRPSQSLSLVYEAIKVEYNTFDSKGAFDGETSAEWNITTGKAAY